MLRWWQARRRRKRTLEELAMAWMARHGPYAGELARQRSMDAYFLGDLEEQELWGRIREIIDEHGESIASDAERNSGRRR